MPENYSAFDSQQWTEFVNNNAGQIPAYAIVRVTGLSVVRPGRVVLSVDQPNAFGCQANCFVNGPVPVSAGQYGYATRSGPVLALYDAADGTPAFGDAWGPRNGTWKLKKNTGGFFCLGPPTNATLALALFAPAPMLTFRGKTTAAAINKGASGTINIYTGPLGSETDSGQTMANVYNRYANAAQGKWVTCGWDFDNQGWELIDLEC
ncbi:MAG TPA: hypothetical protein VKU82_07360 [Planctomycetaceae bacterium]|nr:hypothetical protein [Planctomycetaceae bacterium]